MYKKALFPVHIYQKNIRENTLIRDELGSIIYENYKKTKLKAPDGWFTNHVYTTFDYDSINRDLFPPESKLYETYSEYVGSFFDQDVSFDIVDIWANVYENGEYQEEHTHLRTEFMHRANQFSCIHFLKFDSDQHVPVTFVDPIDTMRYTSIEMKSNHYVDHYNPNVNEGDLIMFPSYLKHYVKPSPPTPGNPRITISFNIALNYYGERSTT